MPLCCCHVPYALHTRGATATTPRDVLDMEAPDWDYQEFRTQHLEQYLDMSAQFMEQELPPELR